MLSSRRSRKARKQKKNTKDIEIMDERHHKVVHLCEIEPEKDEFRFEKLSRRIIGAAKAGCKLMFTSLSFRAFSLFRVLRLRLEDST